MEMITFLKRRFSSGDLQGEAADKREQEGLPGFLRFGSVTSTNMDSNQVYQNRPVPQQQQTQAQPQYPQRTPDSVGGMGQTGAYSSTNGPMGVGPNQVPIAADRSTVTTRHGRGIYPSAPTSPTRSYSNVGSSFMNPMGSITGQISSTIMRGFSNAASTAQQMATGKSTTNKDRQKILLVIDDSQTDWNKYFRGRKIFGDWDIRVEQAQFSEISMTAYSDQGCVINIFQGINRSKPTRSFKPDLVLLRQHCTNSNEDWYPILIGLMYSGTPCMNTLHAVYNMKNRSWLFAHLLMLRNRLGKDEFPLISQTYYTCHKEMITAPAFPTVIKVGHGHVGDGKIRADDLNQYQDIVGLFAAGNLYATTEPFMDAKCDVHVQKIGAQYKSFVRKSIGGHWKSNVGSSIIEKVATTDKFRNWVDEVARMFGGLDICSVEALQNKSGEYFIYNVNGSDMMLFGETQEEDRREIAELVVQQMQNLWKKSSLTKTSSLQSVAPPTEVQIKQVSGFATPQPSSNTNQSTFVRGSSTQLGDQYQPTYPTIPQQVHTEQSQLRQTQHPYIPPQQKPQPMQQPAQSMFSQTQTQPQFQPQFQPSTQQQKQYHSTPQAANQMAFGQSSPSANTASGSWDDQSTHSSISSSGGSASTTHTGIVSNRIDSSKLTSGQTTPIGSNVEPKAQTHQSSLGSTPFQPTWQSQFTASSTESNTSTAWGNQFDNMAQTKPSEFRPVGQKSSPFDSNDPFDNWNSSGKYSQQQDSAMNPISGGSTVDSNRGFPSTQTQNTPNQDRPFVPPRQTSLRTGPGEGETDDTMINLRKTFAGIFGDM